MGFLTVSDLRKTFRDRKKPVEAVKAISFSVERGEMVGLLGPNGAGKTTTIKCILGLVRPDSGVITVGDADCRKDRRKALRDMAAVLEGARNTYWRLTAWENIAYFAGIHGIPEKKGKEYFEYLVDVLRLRDKRDAEVRNLSSGYKQKVAVACALAKKTPLVFLDEPTLGLDVESSYELREALRKLQSEEGRTIIVSSHDMHVVQDICQRAIIISQGEIMADKAIPELLTLFGTRKYRVVVAGEDDSEVATQAREAVGVAFPNASFKHVGGSLEATVDLSERGDIYRLVEVLKESGAAIESLTQEEVDLEKAFLEVVRRGNGQCGFGALKSAWKQNFRLMGRYLFNTLSGFITLYIIFAMLFYGTKSVGAGTMNLGDTLEGMFAGYVTWMLALMGCTDLAWSISNEAQTGTLEQLCLAPVGYKWMLTFSQSFTFFANLLLIAVITVSMSFTTGQAIHLDLPSLFPVVTAIYLQAFGLGFMLAGLALIYKRIQAFFQIVQFALVGILFIPLDAFPLARYMPLAAGHRIMQEVLMDGQRLWQVGWGDVSTMLIATVVYLGAGIAFFTVAESQARSRGLLGQY